MPRLLLIACLAAACAAPPAPSPQGSPSPQGPAPSPRPPHAVALRLVGTLPESGELHLVHESGLSLRLPLVRSGEFDVSLPPGPCSLAMVVAGTVVAEHVFLVADAEGQSLVWELGR
ncbi:MAG: hypothetical protein RL398_500 [Planctomycetota bacterium]|jgi:hypothetical protein